MTEADRPQQNKETLDIATGKGVVEKRVEIGTGYELIEGDEYQGRFTGQAHIASDNDEGSFLSDINTQTYWDNFERGNGQTHYRKELSIAELFPEEWARAEENVEYEIIVRARKIPTTKSSEE